MNKIFGEKLKKLRMDKDLLQKELAEELKTDRSTITAWEIGKAYPTVEMLISIADYFNVSIDYLLGREAENKTENKHFNCKENLKQKAI